MQHANVDAYLPYAGDLAQACIPLGFFTAFCLQHHLLNPEVEQVHADLVTQCRYQEGPVSALFVALGAQLQEQHLSPKGQRFADLVLPGYRERFCEVFGEDSWQIKDEWSHYQRIAASLVRDLYGRPPAATISWAGRVLGTLTRLFR